jgi:hypothetical protein
MERDFDVEFMEGVDPDLVESGLGINVPVGADGRTFYEFEPRMYRRGEIIDADILFNSDLTSE